MSIRFAAFELDLQNYELRKQGSLVPVPRRVFDTIAFLASNADRIVTKQELIEGPWRGQAVTDAALARVIMRARAALDDDSTNPQLLTTVRGRGFRFHLIRHDSALDTTSNARPERVSGHTFVGRANELQVLHQAWTEAREGNGRMLLVTGEPGIGKTALVEYFATGVAQEGILLHGRAWEAGGSPPFWIWSQVLGEYCESRDPSQLRAMAGTTAPDLTRIAPQLREALLELSSSPSVDETLQTRFRVFESIATFLREAASSDPLLVVLEDLHGVDDAALSLLAFICEHLSRSRILLVGTCRSPDWTQRALISTSVRTPGSSVAQLELAGLTEGEIALWLKVRRDPRPPGLTAADIHRATTGHPFLVKDLLESDSEPRSLDRNQHSALHYAGAPEHLATSIRKRLSRVPPETRAVLKRACVIGREFSLSRLSASDSRAAEENLSSLEPALQENLVEQPISGKFTFVHELVRRTVYNDLNLVERLELHHTFAHGLMRSGSSQDSVLEIANHLLLAAPRHGVEEAIRWTLAAVKHAQRKLAHELAADYCRRALQVLETCGDPTLSKGSVQMALGRSLQLAWQGEAETVFRECAQWCESHGLDQTLGLTLVNWFEMLRERVAVHEQYLFYLRLSLSRLSEPSSLRAQLLAVRVIADYFNKTAGERERLFHEALEMARGSMDPHALVAVINLLLVSNINAGDKLETLRLGGEMLAAARAAERPDGAMDALVLRARCLLELGDGDTFRVERVEHERLAREFRYPMQLWHCSNIEYVTAFLDGDLAHAEAILRRSAQTAAPSLGILSIGLFGAQLAFLALEKHPAIAARDFEEAKIAGQKVLKEAPTYQPQIVLLGIFAAESGDRWGAADVLDRFLASGLDKILRDGNHLSCLVLLSRIATATGDASAARTLLEELQPFAGLHAAHWSHYLGPINYYLGKLRLCLGDPAAAIPHFDAAIADARRIGSRTWRVWCEYGRAEALAAHPAAHDPEARREFLLSIRGRAKSLNMGRLLHELDLEESRALRS
jgi:DNA-binding winged helix-turn-helix (wHTH) protein